MLAKDVVVGLYTDGLVDIKITKIVRMSSSVRFMVDILSSDRRNIGISYGLNESFEFEPIIKTIILNGEEYC